MEEPLNFDHQALHDEQKREEKERNWQDQGRTAFLWLLVVFLLASIFIWLGSFIPASPVVPIF